VPIIDATLIFSYFSCFLHVYIEQQERLHIECVGAVIALGDKTNHLDKKIEKLEETIINHRSGQVLSVSEKDCMDLQCSQGMQSTRNTNNVLVKNKLELKKRNLICSTRLKMLIYVVCVVTALG
jgi:hypothetical protein